MGLVRQDITVSTEFPSQTEIQNFHNFALEIATETRTLILQLWESGIFSEKIKEDKTPVTIVDLKAEELARKLILEKYPTHGIIGEEYDSVNPNSNFQWTIDPIDGTQNLVNRIPTFGTLIGLRYKREGVQNEAIMGVIDHPILNLRTSGGLGIGVFHNNLKIELEDLKDNFLSSSDLLATNSLSVFGENARELYTKVLNLHPHSRTYYDCYSQTLALLGSIAVVIEPNLKIWDITPVEAMLNELGGKFQRFGEKAFDSKGNELINSVFGKASAVWWVCESLGIPVD